MVRFAPLNVPWYRRMETLCVTLAVGSQPIGIALTIIFLWFRQTRTFMLMYIGWILFDTYILKTSQRGGRRSDALRKSKWWHHFRNYFPISLERTAELDPKQNYIFGFHPHGIIGIGMFCNFMTEATDFSGKFPGITLYVLGLRVVTMVPFSRDFIMPLGVCDVSKESIDCHLNEGRKQGGGRAVLIIVGGAKEALDAHPGTITLTLENRKGFVKMALRHGAHLVPVLSFGENDVFEQMGNTEGSKLRRAQIWLQQHMGFSMPLMHGRGIFNYDFGFLPFRRRIHTIVGSPIEVPLISEPTDADVHKYHKIYVDGLRQLFNAHKDKYMPDKDLTIN